MELLRWSLPMQGSWIFKIFTKSLLKYSWQLGEMAQAYSPKTSKKGEAEGSQVQGQLGKLNKTVSQNLKVTK